MPSVGHWADLGEYIQLFTATRSGPTVNADGFGQASASASESHFYSHISGQDRQADPNQALKEPRGRVASGQEKTPRSGSEVHSRSSVQFVATSEHTAG